MEKRGVFFLSLSLSLQQARLLLEIESGRIRNSERRLSYLRARQRVSRIGDLEAVSEMARNRSVCVRTQGVDSDRDSTHDSRTQRNLNEALSDSARAPRLEISLSLSLSLIAERLGEQGPADYFSQICGECLDFESQEKRCCFRAPCVPFSTTCQKLSPKTRSVRMRIQNKKNLRPERGRGVESRAVRLKFRRSLNGNFNGFSTDFQRARIDSEWSFYCPKLEHHLE